MLVEETPLSGVKIIIPKVYKDERGYFFESFNKNKLKEVLPHREFVQDNESQSSFGVLRGLHYQIPPFDQAKLVRVIEGKVLDIAVDIRKSSPTFKQYVAVELSSENKHQLYIPRGFAHGFVVLSEMAILNYKVDNYYSQEYERGIIFNDNTIDIDWKLSQTPTVSIKDKILPTLDQADLFD